MQYKHAVRSFGCSSFFVGGQYLLTFIEIPRTKIEYYKAYRPKAS